MTIYFAPLALHEFLPTSMTLARGARLRAIRPRRRQRTIMMFLYVIRLPAGVGTCRRSKSAKMATGALGVTWLRCGRLSCDDSRHAYRHLA